jgi:hypothetical protein
MSTPVILWLNVEFKLHGATFLHNVAIFLQIKRTLLTIHMHKDECNNKINAYESLFSKCYVIRQG